MSSSTPGDALPTTPTGGNVDKAISTQAGEAPPAEPAPSRPPCTCCGKVKDKIWRKGPAGPKTLCNGCGVYLYRNGTLEGRLDHTHAAVVAARRRQSKQNKRKKTKKAKAVKARDRHYVAAGSTVVSDTGPAPGSAFGTLLAAAAAAPITEGKVRKRRKKKRKPGWSTGGSNPNPPQEPGSAGLVAPPGLVGVLQQPSPLMPAASVPTLAMLLGAASAANPQHRHLPPGSLNAHPSVQSPVTAAAAASEHSSRPQMWSRTNMMAPAPFCIVAGCNEIATAGHYYFEPLHCAAHAGAGEGPCMREDFRAAKEAVNKTTLCVRVGCNKYPCFAPEGDKRPLRCKDHRWDDDVDVKNRRCSHPGCKMKPSYGPVTAAGHLRRERCATHSLPTDKRRGYSPNMPKIRDAGARAMRKRLAATDESTRPSKRQRVERSGTVTPEAATADTDAPHLPGTTAATAAVMAPPMTAPSSGMPVLHYPSPLVSAYGGQMVNAAMANPMANPMTNPIALYQSAMLMQHQIAQQQMVQQQIAHHHRLAQHSQHMYAAAAAAATAAAAAASTSSGASRPLDIREQIQMGRLRRQQQQQQQQRQQAAAQLAARAGWPAQPTFPGTPGGGGGT